MTHRQQESIKLVASLYNQLHVATCAFFVSFGFLIAIGLYAVCRLADPENIRWYSLVGGFPFIMLIGYFVAWLPHRRKTLDPLKKHTEELILQLKKPNEYTEQGGAANPLQPSASGDC